MFQDYPPSRQLTWREVEPIVSRLYAYNVPLSNMIWAKEAWSLLDSSDLTSAETPMNELDSLLRAVSIAIFHLIFINYLKPPLGDFDLVRPIQPMVKSVDVATLAVIRYDIDDEGWDDLASSLEHSLACVYRQQIPEALAALQQHYYSSAGFFEDLLRWSPSDQNSVSYHL